MKSESVVNRFFAAIVVNVLTLAYGVCGGWASPSIALLMSDETPLPSGKITMEEASWVGSILYIGGFIGNLFFGFNSFGRKLPLIFITIPAIVSWLLIWFAPNVYHLYAARVLIGFVGGGIFVIVPLFLSEISNDRVRGTLGSMLMLIGNKGLLLAFILGNYCDYYTTPKVVIVLMLLFATTFYVCIPESPMVLVKCNKLTDAENSIRFYSNLGHGVKDRELIQLEIIKLQNDIDMMANSRSTFSLSDLWTRQCIKAIFIGIVLIVVLEFCGVSAMLSYTASIFNESGSNMTPNMSAIVIGAITVLGSYVSTFLVDLTGRKVLFTVSTVGIAIGLTVLGVYVMLNPVNSDAPNNFNWIPLASFSFVIFIASCGLRNLPFVVISEILPEKVKDLVMSLCMSLIWLLGFFAVKFLPFLFSTLGFHGSMFLFTAVCIAGVVFIILIVPETKGKSHAEIMELL